MIATNAADPLGYSELAGTVALVTGASSGIGAESARVLARHGLHVLLVGRDALRLDIERRRIGDEGGFASVLSLDLNDPDAGPRIRGAATSIGAPLTTIVHSAGIFPFGPFEETPADELDRAFRVHVRSPYLITQALLPALCRHASITFVGSNLASVGLANTVAYSATKAAVEAMAQTLAIELAPRGIRVNSVSPGVVLTPMTEMAASNPDWVAAETVRVPVGRSADVGEIAAAILYLASPIARFAVGTRLVIDGGVNAQ